MRVRWFPSSQGLSHGMCPRVGEGVGTRPKHLYPQVRPKYHLPVGHGVQYLDLSSPSREPSLRRWPANDYPADLSI